MIGRIRVAVVMASALVGCLPDYTANRAYGGGGSSDYADEPTVEAPPIGGGFTLTGVPPEFGPTIRQADPPPPLSGGTMAVADDGQVVAADPDRDRVYLADPSTGVFRIIALAQHDEPGRVAIDAAGRAHVVLRRAGQVVTIDRSVGVVVDRQSVCPMPRGIAYEPGADRIHVACGGGELVTFAAAGGVSISSSMITDDLRDVVWSPSRGLLVTTFRSAKILAVADDRSWREILSPPVVARPAHVAWRAIVVPSDISDVGSSLLMAQQRAPDDNPPTPPEYYPGSSGCGGGGGPATIVRGEENAVVIPTAVLPVDIAATRTELAVVGAAFGHTPGGASLVVVRRNDFAFPCDVGAPVSLPGQITSVVYARNKIVALSREPAALFVVDSLTLERDRTIDFAQPSREDTGHAIFYASSGANVACASCHPDGRDDGHAWLSQELGRRRTPSLAGTIANTAPYHWTGEAKDFHAVATMTFESRMKGPALADDQIAALGSWVESVARPVASPAIDPSAASRGEALYGTAGCVTCHSGGERTNNQSLDIGTGGSFQVPSLVGVWARAPYLHDGSRPTLASVIAGHGETPLTSRDVTDLASFLGTF